MKTKVPWDAASPWEPDGEFGDGGTQPKFDRQPICSGERDTHACPAANAGRAMSDLP
jgi:hypothetical protein